MEPTTETIKIDVGGQIFRTTLTTLKQVPDNVILKAAEKSPGKRLFFDRRGDLFVYILDYLRQPTFWKKPLTEEIRRPLRREAKFYCLVSFAAFLKRPKVPVSEYAQLRKFYPLLTFHLHIDFEHRRATFYFDKVLRDNFNIPEKVGIVSANRWIGLLEYLNRFWPAGYHLSQMIKTVDTEDAAGYCFIIELRPEFR